MVTSQPILKQEHLKVIIDFMQEFLPPCKLRHELSCELLYVHTVIEKVIRKKFGFHVSMEMLLETCLQNNYQISTRKASYNMLTRLYVPDKEGTFLNSNPLYKKHQAAFIYLNIDGREVHKLMRLFFTKPLYSVTVKEDAKQLMEQRLLQFKSSHTMHKVY